MSRYLPTPQPSPLGAPLTERERAVLQWLLEGASNRAITSYLVLSVSTVKKHVYNLCSKLGVQSHMQASPKPGRSPFLGGAEQARANSIYFR